ncbi:MAG: lipocalin-like domain-containing protein [Ramlibacter sp.]|nr:lipocalin-like domain-containing protein [Ramlibacter sp.]
MKAMPIARRRLGWVPLMFALLGSGCASTAPSGAPTAASPLLGTWRLVSFEMEAQGTAGKLSPMGKAPAGYLSFLPDGRMAVVITAEGRKPGTSEQERAALYSSLVAYTGRFRVEGDKWVTAVDASANPAWVGTEQPRFFTISGDTLQEQTPWFPRADKTMVRVANVYTKVK